MPSSSAVTSGAFVCVLLVNLALDTTACTNITIGSTHHIEPGGTIGTVTEIIFGLTSTSVISPYWFTGVDMCPANCSSGCYRDLSISLSTSNAGPWTTVYSSGGYIQDESCFRPYNMHLAVPISGPSIWQHVRIVSNGTMRFANVYAVQQSTFSYYSALSSSATPQIYRGVLGNIYYCPLVAPPTINETLPFTAPVTVAPTTFSPTRFPTSQAPTYNPAIGCQEVGGCGGFFFSCQSRTPRMGDAPSCPRTCGAPGCTPTSAPPPTSPPSAAPSSRPPSSAPISSAPSSPSPPSSLGTLAPALLGPFVPTAVPFSFSPPPSSTSSPPSPLSDDDDGTLPPTQAPTGGGSTSAGSGGSSGGGGSDVAIIILIVVLIAVAGAIALVVITRRRRREAAKAATPIHPRGSVVTNPAFASEASRNSAADNKNNNNNNNNNGKRSGGGAMSPQRTARMAQTLAGTGSASKGRVTVDEDRYVAGPAHVQGAHGNDYLYAEPAGPSQAARAPQAGRGDGKKTAGANSGRGGRGRGGRGRGGGPSPAISKPNAAVDDYAYQMPIPTQDNEYEVPVAVNNEYETPALSLASAKGAKDSDVYYGLPDVSKAKPAP